MRNYKEALELKLEDRYLEYEMLAAKTVYWLSEEHDIEPDMLEDIYNIILDEILHSEDYYWDNRAFEVLMELRNEIEEEERGDR